jgi:CheY-like chemotaxis protein
MESILPQSFDGRRERPLVLIVDDDRGVRESLAAVMEAFGFRTRTAENGFEGLETLKAEIPSAIITDLNMPEMDGFELMSALRRMRTAVPVIVMSGGIPGGLNGGYDFLQAARRLGAVATFRKPLAVLELVDTISGLTAQHAA